MLFQSTIIREVIYNKNIYVENTIAFSFILNKL